MIGRAVSHYRVIDRLGAGGMGEVYLAEDTRLGRQVALKVLPEAFGDDPERLARFEREAKVLASLAHPNIGAIFGLEEVDGQQLIVLELVPGETLADRVSRGRLPPQEALELARQIAEALETAHGQGIVHRDLKPGNVMVVPAARGQPPQAKVLDFGLARAPAPAAAGMSQHPTRKMTEVGTLLGTPSYMSPEQARGQSVDARSDIWAFGCLVYECLTGRQAFDGASTSDILAAVLHQEPDWEALPPDTPWRLQEVLARTLEKDPESRLHHMADARIEIVMALAGSSGPTLPSSAGERRQAIGAAPSRSRRWSLGTWVGVTALALVATWGWLRPSPEPVRPVTRFLIHPPSLEGSVGHFLASPPALSPDGTTLAYVVALEGRRRPQGLYLRELDRLEDRPIPATEGARGPFFSPDGRWLGFWADGELKKVPVEGGPAVTIATTGLVTAASWSPDDRIVYAGVASGLKVVAASGGVPEPLTRLQNGGTVSHYVPSVLPGGRAVLFASFAGTSASRQVGLADLDTGEWRILLQDAYAAQYSPSGQILFVRFDGSVWAVAFDLETLRVTGEPVLAMEGKVRVRRGVFFTVAANGTAVYLPPSPRVPGELAWVDSTGVATALASFPPQFYQYPRLSPGGERVVVSVSEPDGGREALWVLDLERGIQTRLTVSGSVNRWPVWTDDGARITFASTRDDSPFDLYRKPVDGSGDAELLFSSDKVKIPTSWSPGRKTLAFYQMEGMGDIWALPEDGRPAPVLQSAADERAPMLSTEGAWLAYVSDESGQSEIYVVPFPGPGDRTKISDQGGVEPAWSHDDRQLFYRHEQRMMAVAIGGGGTLGAGAPRVLFEGPYELGPFGRGNPNYDVGPDGRFLMVQRGPSPVEPVPIHVVLNWLGDLETRLAGD